MDVFKMYVGSPVSSIWDMYHSCSHYDTQSHREHGKGLLAQKQATPFITMRLYSPYHAVKWLHSTIKFIQATTCVADSEDTRIAGGSPTAVIPLGLLEQGVLKSGRLKIYIRLERSMSSSLLAMQGLVMKGVHLGVVPFWREIGQSQLDRKIWHPQPGPLCGFSSSRPKMVWGLLPSSPWNTSECQKP